MSYGSLDRELTSFILEKVVADQTATILLDFYNRILPKFIPPYIFIVMSQYLVTRTFHIKVHIESIHEGV